MLVGIATLLSVALQAYLGLGLLFAIAFVLFGVQRIDPAARGGTWGFRLMIIPGAMALWPLMLRRWMLGLPPPEERSAHRRAAARAWGQEEGGSR